MSTPSKKLNDFLRSSNRASRRADADIAAEAEIQPDRDLSPETKAAVAETLAHLRSASGNRRRVA